MRLTEIEGKRLVIWGTGREGLAAAQMIRARFPAQPLVFLDESSAPAVPSDFADCPILTTPEARAEAIAACDVLIKSPGVSLYHPLIAKAEESGVAVTSLLNLWSAENQNLFKIGVTGTKGKSTTASLLSHVLSALGRKVALAGNIGTPVTAIDPRTCDVCVIEVSSYQAANFTEQMDIGVLVSLYPEHLNWHLSLEQYYADKANLLAHSRTALCLPQAAEVLRAKGLGQRWEQITDDRESLSGLANAYLKRAHNLPNVHAVLAVCKTMGLDQILALKAMEAYCGLPHRQQEITTANGLLFVDDSISTTPQSAIAAMEVYRNRPVTLLMGGQDRGVDYAPLLAYLASRADLNVICLGEVGRRLYPSLQSLCGPQRIASAATMVEAVGLAKNLTPQGGVVLLSPAAPSYDMFKDFTARAQAFHDAISASGA